MVTEQEKIEKAPRFWELGQAMHELRQKLDGFIGEWRIELAKHSDELAKHSDELAKHSGELAKAGELRDSLIRQLMATSSTQGTAPNPITGIDNGAGVVQLRKQHLDLVEKVFIGVVTSDPPLTVHGQTEFDPDSRLRGLDWPKSAFSMIGAARMHNFRVLVEQAIIGGIPGDIVETGVWRGGASMMAKAVIDAYGDATRRVYLADSFAGLPPPDPEKYPLDKGLDLHLYEELAVSEEEVRANFAKIGLLDDRVITVKGWFRDTMKNFPAKSIAVLRLDGDLYESTIDPLNYLFDRVSPGGWIIVDDYEVFDACKQAVRDFLRARRLTPDIKHIDGVGVYFQKDALLQRKRAKQ